MMDGESYDFGGPLAPLATQAAQNRREITMAAANLVWEAFNFLNMPRYNVNHDEMDAEIAQRDLWEQHNYVFLGGVGTDLWECSICLEK